MSRGVDALARARASTSSAVRPKMKMLSSPTRSLDLDIGAVERADGQRAVQRQLHVAGARASMPAVEICSDRSAAGMIISARLTL